MKYMHLITLALFLIPGISRAQFRAITYEDKGQKLTSLYSDPVHKNGLHAGVLILPAWMGIQSHEKEVAQQLNGLGYHTLIADIYGEGKYPKDSKEAGDLSGYYKKNIESYQDRIRLALDQLIKAGANKDHIVVIGYCFGGTGAIEAARTNMPVAGIVSFHGGLSRDPSRTIVPIRPRLLILHGADDFFISREEIAAFQDEMRKAQADWQMNYYANAVHSFTDRSAGDDNSKGVAYNARADQRSWKALLAFLDEVFMDK